MKIAIIGAGFFGATAALKLSKYHDLIHISPNKIVSSLDLKLGYPFPYVVELTYVKKKQ